MARRFREKCLEVGGSRVCEQKDERSGVERVFDGCTKWGSAVALATGPAQLAGVGTPVTAGATSLACVAGSLSELDQPREQIVIGSE